MSTEDASFLGGLRAYFAGKLERYFLHLEFISVVFCSYQKHFVDFAILRE